MALTLSLPPLDPSPAHPPETRPAQVFAWLDATLKRNAIEAARMVGEWTKAHSQRMSVH